MNTLFAVGILGGWELLLILVVVLVLFGAKKLPELAKGLGQGIKEFKKATTEVQNEINSSMDDSRYTQQQQRRIDNPPEPRPSEHSAEHSTAAAAAPEAERKS